MKKLTAKQRAKIYRKAAEMIQSAYESFCCSAISELLFRDRCHPQDALYVSPELQLFKPDNNPEIGLTIGITA